MYNRPMPPTAFEIRSCLACGLRYPLLEGHRFGTRCPICMGETRLIITRKLVYETGHPRPASDLASNRSALKGTRLERRGACAVLLDNIRSAWNTGSILRSADGFGFAHVYLCGITPTPEHEAVTKTALGAEDSVPWSYHKDAVKLVTGLKKAGWKIFALEETPQAVSLEQVHRFRGEPTEKTLLIAGSEVTGVDPGLLELCDQILYIPMRGDKQSFNVAIAFSIAAYELNQ